VAPRLWHPRVLAHRLGPGTAPTLKLKPHGSGYKKKARNMSIGMILLIILILILIGALPTWPHSRSWGYYPSGGIGVVLIIIIILLLMGRI
jgi:hypothetical protein